jgi:hypothetical protein
MKKGQSHASRSLLHQSVTEHLAVNMALGYTSAFFASCFCFVSDGWQNRAVCLSEYVQSDCGFSHLQTSKYIYECCDVSTKLRLTTVGDPPR